MHVHVHMCTDLDKYNNEMFSRFYVCLSLTYRLTMMKKMQSPCLQLIVLFLLSAHTSEGKLKKSLHTDYTLDAKYML